MLRSWAVPKGLPDDPARDRLAIAVDDHALDHVDFEDEHKSVADTGTWEARPRTAMSGGWCSCCTAGPGRAATHSSTPTAPSGCCT